MKSPKPILLAAALTATLSLGYNASAQYKPVGDDGIAASPKVRQMLYERAAALNPAAPTAGPAVTYRIPGPSGLAASPKVRQTLEERKVVVGGASSAEVASVGYRATGPDGITASPKARQQLDERRIVRSPPPRPDNRGHKRASCCPLPYENESCTC